MSSDPVDRAEELAHRSGFQSLLSRLKRVGAAVAEVQMARARDETGALSPEARLKAQVLGQRVERAIAAVAFDEATATLAAGRPEDLAAALLHFRDPRADTIALERDAINARSGQIRLGHYFAKRREEPAPAALQVKVDAMVTLAADAELLTALTVDVSETVHAALGIGGRGVDDAARTSFLTDTHRRTVARDLYLFETLGEGILDYRLAFYRSQAGAWFAKARLDAVRRIDVAIARALTAPKTPPGLGRGD